MGERQPAALSDVSPDEVAPPTDAWTPNERKTSAVMLVIQAMGLLLGAVAVSWVLLDDRLLPSEEKNVLELAVILGAIAIAFGIAAYSRQRSVKAERLYSSHLEDLSRQLRDMAYRDALTGLYNHRYFQEQLAHEVERAQRYGARLSVLMLDVDRFKQVNDTYGHLMGDTLLSYIAKLIGAKVRTSDVPARYGGDEFSVILPETGQEKALAVAEKLSEAVSSDRHWQSALLEKLGAGISFGVASFPDDGRTADDLLVCADRRLYDRKRRRSASNRQNGGSTHTPVDMVAR